MRRNVDKNTHTAESGGCVSALICFTYKRSRNKVFVCVVCRFHEKIALYMQACIFTVKCTSHPNRSGRASAFPVAHPNRRYAVWCKRPHRPFDWRHSSMVEIENRCITKMGSLPTTLLNGKCTQNTPNPSPLSCLSLADRSDSMIPFDPLTSEMVFCFALVRQNCCHLV